MDLNLPIYKALSDKVVVLASASPRRREILESMGIKFSVVTTLKPDENDPTKYKTRADYVVDTASMKAQEVFDRCESDPTLPNADIVIGADTVVVQDECVLEKPKDKEDALRMLGQLSGKTHYAITGVQIIYKKKDGTVEKQQFYEKTNVKFCEIDTETMNAYVDSGESFDKAGAYAIQGSASFLFVDSIEGDIWAVVGLPKNHLFRELIKIVCV